jgi:aryl sulfotransferase
MSSDLPQITRTYQNHTLDSTHWTRYAPRTGDIVIATSYKSGTTWCQEIVRRLIFWGQADEAWRSIPLSEISPWLDLRVIPLDAVLNQLEAQPHRRFLKTHVALDGLPYYAQVKYLVVGRDARDVFMSYLNHFANFNDEFMRALNDAPGRVGPPCPMPAYANDVHEFWRNWITRGWFPWESEGYPCYGNMHHTQSWWNFRHLENILFVHYNDLLTDLPSELRRIAGFLDIALADDVLAAIVQDVSLASLRRAAASDPLLDLAFKEGAQTFFFKGTNGRWRGVLSEEELAMYDATAARVLMPDCRAWLEQGRIALASQPVLANSQVV